MTTVIMCKVCVKRLMIDVTVVMELNNRTFFAEILRLAELKYRVVGDLWYCSECGIGKKRALFHPIVQINCVQCVTEFLGPQDISIHGICAVEEYTKQHQQPYSHTFSKDSHIDTN